MIFFLSGCDRQRKKNRDEGFAIRKKKRKFFDGAGFGRKRKKGTTEGRKSMRKRVDRRE